MKPSDRITELCSNYSGRWGSGRDKHWIAAVIDYLDEEYVRQERERSVSDAVKLNKIIDKLNETN